MRGQSEDIPSSFSKNLNNILQKCLTKRPYERPSARDLLRTPYFLEAMKWVISQKADNKHMLQNRIPIKRYKVHTQNLQKKKINNSSKDTPKLSKNSSK